MNKNKKKEVQISSSLSLIFGSFSAMFAKTIVAPLDRVKIVFQTQDANNFILKCEKRRYNGIFFSLKKIIKEEGIISLWRGHIPNLLRYVPSQAFNFLFNSYFNNNKKFKFQIRNDDYVKYTMVKVLKGGLAGGLSICIFFPLDFARIRLSANIQENCESKRYKGLTDVFRKIYRVEGTKGLFVGFIPSFWYFFVYRGFYFGLFASGKKYLPKLKKNIISKFFLASSVTIIAGLIAFPLDIIRKRLIMQSGKCDQTIQYNNMRGCVRSIINKEGFKGFYKGALINVYRSYGASLVLIFYDQFVHLYKERKSMML